MVSVSKRLLKFFEKNKNTIDLPFFHSFPKNCCEEASLILGSLLKDEYPSVNVKYVEGQNQNGQLHYWIEADDLIFDITVDQFSNIPNPLFGKKQHPLIVEFSETTKYPIAQALENSDRIDEEYCLFIRDWFHRFESNDATE